MLKVNYKGARQKTPVAKDNKSYCSIQHGVRVMTQLVPITYV